ncbi:MAG TPA: long-chain fatty acid--CoA ligase [Acidimicrobiales bacterium]|nr:long-chain fatty acid--CoA ligase [Acidimicrobiales bacterium]
MDVLLPRRARGTGPVDPGGPPPIESGQTLVDVFLDRVDRWPDRVALRHVQDGEWATISWSEYGAAAREVAAGLIALGIAPTDRVGILAGNQPRWHMADVGILTAGGISVPAYPTGVASQVAHVFGHSGCRVCFVGDHDQLAKVLLARASLPDLERIVTFDSPPDGLDDDVLMTFDDLLERGRAHLAEHPAAVDERTAGLQPDAVATLVYTSGTTGAPKGTMITHRNVSETVRSITQVVSVGPTDRFLSFLPLSHIAERCVSHMGQIISGGETWFARSLATVPEDLQACRPTVVFAVPRVWEKFEQGVHQAVAALPGVVQRGVERLVELGRASVDASEGNRHPLSLRDRLAHAALDRTLGAVLRRRMGLDAGRIFVSAAAPIDPELLRWFASIGVPIGEVYGQTEDCGPTTMNRPGRIRIGTVGEALPGVDVRIAEDGEVLVRGPNVCAGYWEDPAATAELIRDGWMHSGDTGVMEDGFLRITGRKKDLIVTSSGKNIAPQDMETELRSHPLISQAIVVGDGRKFLSALVTLDADAAEQAVGGSRDVEALAGHPTILAAVGEAVDRLNAGRARAERIKSWRILPRDLTISEGELTPTLKVRRSVVIDRYAELVEEIYAA